MNDLAVGARPQDVIPGVPEDVEALAARLAVYADQAGEAAARLRAIDAGAWVGEAGDAFREAIGELPAKLERGCDAFWDAVYALRAYSTTLREAQATAARAIEIFTEADHQTSVWAAQSQSNKELGGTGRSAVPLPEAPPALDDPGERLRQEARRLVEQAREEVEAVARRSAARLKEAGDAAPNKPGFFRRALSAVGDLGRGAVEGTVGMATFAFKLSPTYALVDPDGYVENLAGMGKGLVYGVTHPVEFAKAVTNWEMWLDNPARALGQLVPEVALALATAGAGGAAKGAGTARRMAGASDDVASVGRVTRSADELAEVRAAGTVVSKAEAQELLASKGFKPMRAESFVESFEGPITVREVRAGERFLRYTDNPSGKGSFLTTTKFDSTTEAVKGLALEDYGNRATYVQDVMARQQSLVLEGGIAGGSKGVAQTVITDSEAFEFGAGRLYP